MYKVTTEEEEIIKRFENAFDDVPVFLPDCQDDDPEMSWGEVREIVWDRDGGVCQVCLVPILYDWYECGHIFDRWVGGEDVLSNVVCMCNVCNRHKPRNLDTREKYIAWVIRQRRREIREMFKGAFERDAKGLPPEPMSEIVPNFFDRFMSAYKTGHR